MARLCSLLCLLATAAAAAPQPIAYAGTSPCPADKKGNRPKHFPGTIRFVPEKHEKRYRHWEEAEFPLHWEPLHTWSIDINEKATGLEMATNPTELFGPDVPFKVVDKFVWDPGGGAVFVELPDGLTIGFAHLTEISTRAWEAAKSGRRLPPGTWLGTASSIIGCSTGPHIHVQGWWDAAGAKALNGARLVPRGHYEPRLRNGPWYGTFEVTRSDRRTRVTHDPHSDEEVQEQDDRKLVVKLDEASARNDLMKATFEMTGSDRARMEYRDPPAPGTCAGKRIQQHEATKEAKANVLVKVPIDAMTPDADGNYVPWVPQEEPVAGRRRGKGRTASVGCGRDEETPVAIDEETLAMAVMPMPPPTAKVDPAEGVTLRGCIEYDTPHVQNPQAATDPNTKLTGSVKTRLRWSYSLDKKAAGELPDGPCEKR